MNFKLKFINILNVLLFTFITSNHIILPFSRKDFERKTKKLRWSVMPSVYPCVHLSATLSGKSVQRMRATFIIVSGNTGTHTHTHNRLLQHILRVHQHGPGEVRVAPNETERVLEDFFNF